MIATRDTSRPRASTRALEAAGRPGRRAARAAARVAVLTGAGVSTDSGIPDYRGEGAPVRTPMTFQQFLADERGRQRYWAGSHLGWRHFSAAAARTPATARSPRSSWPASSTAIITQNVDGLHLRAGSRRVVDIHGSMDRVRCLHCGQTFARADIAERMARDEPVARRTRGRRAQPRRRRRRRGRRRDDRARAARSAAASSSPRSCSSASSCPSRSSTRPRALVRAADALRDRRVVAGRQLRHPAARSGGEAQACRSSSSTAA